MRNRIPVPSLALSLLVVITACATPIADEARDASSPLDGGAVGADGSASLDAAPAIDASSDDLDAQAPLDAGEPVAIPDRVVFVVTPHGTLLDEWRADATLEGRLLAPLAPWRERIVRLDGLDVPLELGLLSLTHSAPGAVLGGGARPEPFVDGPVPVHGPPGPTIDQYIARALGPAARVPSIELGIGPFVGAQVAHSFAGPDRPLASIQSPGEALARLGVDVALDPIADPRAAVAYPDVARAHFRVLTAALAADATRVATVDFGQVGVRFTWLGVDEEYMVVAHAATASDPGAIARYASMQRWYAEQIASFVAALAATPERDGTTLLDHTLVVWVHDSGGPPSAHSASDVPVLLVGDVGAGLVGDRIVRTDRPIGDLWHTIAEALGVDPARFGDPARPTRRIDGLFERL